MSKHKYLISVACKTKISGINVSRDNHCFPYTESIIESFRSAAMQHTDDESTFILSITYLGELDEH